MRYFRHRGLPRVRNRISPVSSISLLFYSLRAGNDSIPIARPHPPQTPPAQFKRSYRNCPGRMHRAQPRLVCRGSPDRNLTFFGTNRDKDRAGWLFTASVPLRRSRFSVASIYEEGSGSQARRRNKFTKFFVAQRASSPGASDACCPPHVAGSQGEADEYDQLLDHLEVGRFSVREGDPHYQVGAVFICDLPHSPNQSPPISSHPEAGSDE